MQKHRELAAEHGHQADWVANRALTRGPGRAPEQKEEAPKAARQAVTYAREHVFERAAVGDGRAILQAAMG